MSNIERRFFQITDTVVSEPEPIDGVAAPSRLEGYAAVFDSESVSFGDFYEVIAPGAFARSLAEASTGGRRIHALWSHREDQPLGSTGTGKLQLREDAKGLWFSLDVSRFNPAQLDACRDGDVRMSFGFQIRDKRWYDRADGTTVREILDCDLIEVSPVVNPAYPDTSAALRSMQEWRSATLAEQSAQGDEPGADVITIEAPDDETQASLSLQSKKLDALERLLRL